MIISDLNHVEVVSEASRIEGGSFYEADVIYGTVLFGSLTAGVAYGNIAVAEAGSLAIGYGSFSKTATSTVATPVSSQSGSFSIAVTN
ncbi:MULTISPECIES: hypothetical protein [unclassified Microcoleus]|uniref:hypothetical protein n=1 Tax=unclassified Microcoleus TaxID=2642155 RepID=UPI002FD71C2F